MYGVKLLTLEEKIAVGHSNPVRSRYTETAPLGSRGMMTREFRGPVTDHSRGHHIVLWGSRIVD